MKHELKTQMKTEIASGKTVTGDLISLAEQGEFDVIIHGCNCFCTVGSGIAKQIRETYPQAYAADCTTKRGDVKKLGLFTSVDVHSEILTDTMIPITDSPLANPVMIIHNFTIVNMYTQFGFNPAVKPCNYYAIRQGFALVKKVFGGDRIGYPAIGAGLAGGHWPRIADIIEEELEGEDHTFVQWNQA